MPSHRRSEAPDLGRQRGREPHQEGSAVGRPDRIVIAWRAKSVRQREESLARAIEPVDADRLRQLDPGGNARRVRRPRDEPAGARERCDDLAFGIAYVDRPAASVRVGSISQMPPVWRPYGSLSPVFATLGRAGVRAGKAVSDPDWIPAVPVGHEDVTVVAVGQIEVRRPQHEAAERDRACQGSQQKGGGHQDKGRAPAAETEPRGS